MEHYIVINNWSNEYENDVTILGIAHTLEEAKKIFNESINDERDYAEEHEYTVYADTEVDFDAGEEGYYSMEHTRLYIQYVPK